jgi:hypothetical protein
MSMEKSNDTIWIFFLTVSLLYLSHIQFVVSVRLLVNHSLQRERALQSTNVLRTITGVMASVLYGM